MKKVLLFILIFGFATISGYSEVGSSEKPLNREIDVFTGSDNRGHLSIQFSSEKQFQVRLLGCLSHWVVTSTYYFENDIPTRKDEKISHNGEVKTVPISKGSKDYRDALFLKDVVLKEENGVNLSSWFRKGVYVVDPPHSQAKKAAPSPNAS